MQDAKDAEVAQKTQKRKYKFKYGKSLGSHIDLVARLCIFFWYFLRLLRNFCALCVRLFVFKSSETNLVSSKIAE
jgi:hypothetical protein